jgi:hypothetical protein
MTYKRCAAALLLLCMLLSLCACGAKYKDDVALSKITGVIDPKLGVKDLKEMNSGYLSGAMRLDPASFASYAVKVNASGVSIDEYGLFRAPDKDSVSDVKDQLEGYLKLRRDSWMDGYMPEEKPKLEKAEIREYGIYVLYVIASDEAREEIFQAVEKLLKK